MTGIIYFLLNLTRQNVTTTISRTKMSRTGSGPEFHVNLGRVGLGQFTCGSGWVWSRKLDPRTTLAQRWTLKNNVSVLSAVA